MSDSGRLFGDDEAGEALFEVNPSRVQCYLDCPRQYRFRYVDKLTVRRSTPHAAIGRSVHKALRDFYALAPSGRTLDTLLTALRRAWDPSGFSGRIEQEDGMTRAEDMLRRFFAAEDHAAIRPLALESKFAFPHVSAGILVTGRVDRLDTTADGYVIVDYKTGRYTDDPESIHESLPLSLYAMAVSGRLGGDVSTIVLHHLASGGRWETRRDAGRLAEHWRLLVGLVERIRSDTRFAPEPGPRCRWCDYLDSCDEGRAAARAG